VCKWGRRRNPGKRRRNQVDFIDDEDQREGTRAWVRTLGHNYDESHAEGDGGAAWSPVGAAGGGNEHVDRGGSFTRPRRRRVISYNQIQNHLKMEDSDVVIIISVI
jgi:hypothetical protein